MWGVIGVLFPLHLVPCLETVGKQSMRMLRVSSSQRSARGNTPLRPTLQSGNVSVEGPQLPLCACLFVYCTGRLSSQWPLLSVSLTQWLNGVSIVAVVFLASAFRLWLLLFDCTARVSSDLCSSQKRVRNSKAKALYRSVLPRNAV